ncbi:hypothetical protein V7087_26220 [Neobacillus niacini]|uniref:hypothetical protein n=1 Tax=Neobacillus niacini TaxID=86668 RepID=UPI002FFF8D8F
MTNFSSNPDGTVSEAEGNEHEIVTEINKNNQEQLVIPDPLWNAIIHTPEWTDKSLGGTIHCSNF